MSDLYNESLERFIDLSTQDSTALVSKEHAINGLMKILSCYRDNQISYDNVHIVALPDFTFTRNKLRWDAGFSYGCIFLLQPNVDPIIPLECRPNCCGIILSKIPTWNYDNNGFCNKLLEIIQSYNEIDIDDFKRRNHFVSILSDSKGNYYSLFHGSFAKVKRDSYNLPGLYPERSNFWNQKISTSSSFDDFKYLIGNHAEEYFTIYKQHEVFTLKYRKLIFDELFHHNHEVLFNETHEGLYDISTILMGAYGNKKKFECPIMLSPESDIPIVENNVSLKILSKSMSIHLRDLFCCPHGGGYMWSYVKKAELENSLGKGYTKLTMKNNDSIMFCDNIGDMPFQYRTNVANFWSQDKKACRIVNKLKPIFFAKF